MAQIANELGPDLGDDGVATAAIPNSPCSSTQGSRQDDGVLLKLAEAILKSKEPCIKRFDGALSKYTAFKARF